MKHLFQTVNQFEIHFRVIFAFKMPARLLRMEIKPFFMQLMLCFNSIIKFSRTKIILAAWYFFDVFAKMRRFTHLATG